VDGRLVSSGLRSFGLAALLLGAAANARAQAYTAIDLGSIISALPNGFVSSSTAGGINTSGQVVGSSYSAVEGFKAFLYSGGNVTELGTLPGGLNSYARAINTNGQVVGAADTPGGFYHAFLYSAGSMTDLGTLPGGTASYAYGINVSGQVVGYSDTTGGAQHAFLYSAGIMTDLGTLSNGSASYAYGINNSGLVVGSSYSSAAGFRAFLYSSGTMTDLNNQVALPAGDDLLQANAINDSGLIAVYGGDAYLLTPGNPLLTGITIQTSPAGLQFSIDGGVAQIAPQTVYLTQTTHTVAVAATQAGSPGTQYVFTGWSDSGTASRSITVGASAATYTAAFKTQYQLTTAAFPGSEGAVSPATGQFYDSGASVTVTAVPTPPYVFGSWSGAATGTTNPTTVTMNGAESVTGNFVLPALTCEPTGDAAPSVADVQLIVNEALGTAPPMHDLTGDGAVNVGDIQIEVNAVLGLGCTAR
jgi:probable HAF family extracellular repeat protein